MQRLPLQSVKIARLGALLDNIPRRPWERLRRSSRRGTTEKSESLGQRFFRNRADDTLPLVVTHERIYILPSARGWMFVASLLVMLIASINYSLSLGYALCFLLTGLFASALLATYRNLAGLTMNSVSANATTSGKTLSWQMTLHVEADSAMQTRRGIILRTEDTKTDVNLDGAEPQSIIHRVPAGSRGWQALGRITLSSDYPLGLWRTWCYLHVPEYALVLPEPEVTGPDLPAGNTDARCQGKKPTQLDSKPAASGEFSGLRPYRDGDSINTIASKSVARGQRLHSMAFNEPTTTSPLTLDWNSTKTAGDIEARLSRLAHWVNLAHASGEPWRLELPDDTLPLDSGASHAALSMRALALFGQPENRAAKGVDR